MAFLDTNHQRAALLILLLGAALAVALAPYATGLVGIPVLYVVFAPIHAALAKRIPRGLATTLVTALAVFLITVPGISLAGLIVTQAQGMAAGVVQSPLLARLGTLHVGTYDLGPQLVGAGEKVVAWIGSSLFGLIGSAAHLVLNLLIMMFGFYFLLHSPGDVWRGVGPYVPFSPANTERLRERFKAVTTATIIGTGLTAVIQGTLVGAAFEVLGLPSGLFWGVITAVLAILPVVGSGLVWGPGAIALAAGGRWPAAIGLAVWGVLVVGNVDYVIRPMIGRHYAGVHPLVTLLGALAAVPYFGILGLLVGPLALSYFFEIIKMYGEEYLSG
ncbi:MAG TPA: AI-2E family transporter [Gemmatimonadales bacterium]|nr:AI-2E family transporter [Gemmatimonadales bacterium]